MGWAASPLNWTGMWQFASLATAEKEGNPTK
jgi:hypothetical protein